MSTDRVIDPSRDPVKFSRIPEGETRIVLVTPDVPLFCNHCHDTEAPEYRLRRAAGKYIALCFKNGEGCWERTTVPQCEYTDNQGVQCLFESEWEVRFGSDQLMRTNRCVAHVGPALCDVGEHRVFPI